MSSIVHAKLYSCYWWSAPHIEVDMVEARLDWPIEEAITMIKEWLVILGQLVGRSTWSSI